MKKETLSNTLAFCAFTLAVALAPMQSTAQSGDPTSNSQNSQTAIKIKTGSFRPNPSSMTEGYFQPMPDDESMRVAAPSQTGEMSDMATIRDRTQVYTTRTINALPFTEDAISETSYVTTAIIVDSPETGWWTSPGPTNRSTFHPEYGWLTLVNYPWGNVLYTYGYQVVNYRSATGYTWTAYPGIAGVAYPVIYR
ncbi:MAG: hypothetical protein KIT11_09375 [Fimbriimonadaceae bacterium]|nr:hypothetical protein [Fimbriimonadaceae bacterium]QYK55538.1 MAG: hypothetical protein KF733_11045 [Fimbriimonadaceae bacterium]